MPRIFTVLLICFVRDGNLSENNITPTFESSGNLKGIFVRATAPEKNLTQGEVTFEKYNGQLRYKNGFGVDVLYSLQIALGFQIQVITAKGWATQHPNGTWFGMARQIIDREADLSIAKTSILPNRAKDLAYLVPTHGLGLYAFFVQPSSNSARDIFLEPFSINLWICLISTYFILIISVSILSCLANHTIGLSYEDYGFSKEIILWGFYTICQHGFYPCPKIVCLRISFISGVLLGLIIYISYSAQLYSMFSIESVPIKSMTDLLHSKMFLTIDENNKAARNMLEINDNGNEDPISNLLREHLKGQKNYLLSAKEGGAQVLKSGTGFLTFKDTFYTTSKNSFGTSDDEFCQKVSTVSVTNVKFKSGLFVAKGSPFKEPFNTKIIAMYNSGLMIRYVKKYEETYSPDCDQDKLRSAPVIDLTDVIFAFYCMLCGMVFSFILCCMEILYSTRIRSSKIVLYY